MNINGSSDGDGSSNGHGGNGNKGTYSSGIATGSLPYQPSQSQNAQPVADEAEMVFESDEMSAVTDPEVKLRTKRRRKRIAGVLLILLFVIGVGSLAGFYLIRRSMKVEMVVGDKRAQPTTRNEAANSGDNLTQQAIKEMRDTTRNAPAMASSGVETLTVAPQAMDIPAITGEQPSQTTSTLVIPEGLAGTINTPPSTEHTATGQIRVRETGPERRTETGESAQTRAGSAQASGRVSRESNPPLISRTVDHSIYITEATPESKLEAARERASAAASRPARGSGKSAREVARETEPRVVVPIFGTMLPVRTLGAIYTLRSGALTRFELTREVHGRGWSLQRGTVFVGTLRGGEYDRAYMAMTGFIDPQTNRLVKIGGDVLGADGASGLKGKRRRLSSRWTRALGEAARSAINLTQSALAGRNGGTTVIMPGVGSVVGPELSGLQGKGNNREFVEVEAGTPAYVMITDLPETTKGVDALAGIDGDAPAEVLGADDQASSGGLTDAELATLLSSGSAEQIRAALPRMTVEMRRIAQAVLGQAERQ